MIQIGEELNGGIIFYVDQSGEHGLITSLYDIGNITWGNRDTIINNTNTGIATYPDMAIGLQNTILISNNGDINSAANLCKNYSYGEYTTDWFLPSKDELNLMYINIKEKLTPNYYWSSSEYTKFAWQQHFQTGTQCKIYKDITAYVRAVRTF